MLTLQENNNNCIFAVEHLRELELMLIYSYNSNTNKQ
jgi:hypothetical protein